LRLLSLREMSERNFLLQAFGISILINLFLFALLPLFGERNGGKSDLKTIIPVNLVQLRRPKPPPPPEEKEPPEEKPPEPIPKMRWQHTIPKRKLKLKLPELAFEINPKLSQGIPVAPPPDITRPYEPGEVDQTPFPILRMKPIYPYYARKLNIEGYVEVKFLVDEGGRVSNITITDSNPPGIFDESVLNALPSWRFSPGKIAGKPVCTWVVTTIQFKIEN